MTSALSWWLCSAEPEVLFFSLVAMALSLSLSSYIHTRYGDDAGKSTKCEEHNIENKNNTSWRQSGKLNIPLCWVEGCLRLEKSLEIGKDWVSPSLVFIFFQLLGALSAFTVHSILTFVDELAELSSEGCSLPARKMKKTGTYPKFEPREDENWKDQIRRRGKIKRRRCENALHVPKF